MSRNPIGLTLLNQFRVEAFVASGGMGAVYRVWDLKRNVPLAMKMLHAELADDPSILRRFQREAEALTRLAHPNIVPFYGFYQTEAFAFLLERFVDGPTLAEILRRNARQPLPLLEALAYLKALCAALGYAHNSGVVHCDVKPGNVMVDQGGVVTLTDFGIMRHSDSVTTTTGTSGTPAYMAPEQIRGEAVTPAADVYALGIVLYELLTGQRPFRGDETEAVGGSTAERILFAHLRLPPPDPRLHNPAIVEPLARVMLRALEKDAAQRFGHAQEFFAAVCAALNLPAGRIPDRVTPPQAEEQTLAPAQTQAAQVLIPLVPPPAPALPARRNWLPWALGGGALLLVCLAVTVVGVLLALNRSQAAETPVARATRTPRPRTPTAEWTPTAPFDFATPNDTQPAQPSAAPTSLPTAPPTAAPTAQPTAAPPTAEPTRAPTAQPTAAPPTAEPTSALPEAGALQYSPVDGMAMVFIPPGSFWMGSPASDSEAYDDEKPYHEVWLSGFWMDRTEVTNAMFAVFVAATGHTTQAERDGGGQAWDGSDWIFASGADWRRPLGSGSSIAGLEQHPVVMVSWYDAKAYCEWAGRRLPSEAEWEKAALGTDGRPYPWGSAAPAGYLLNYADVNFDALWSDTSANDGYTFSAPVGSYPSGASPYGVLDMAGNVYEWLADWYGKSYYSESPEENPRGPASGELRVLRSSSWYNKIEFIRSRYREGYEPTVSASNFGFRCAATP